MTARTIASRPVFALLLSVVLARPVGSQQNHIDLVTPVAPELAAFGPHAIGVRTLTASEADRIDVLNTTADGAGPTADSRPDAGGLVSGAGRRRGPAGGPLRGDHARSGRARDAGRARCSRRGTARDGRPFPLVIISHGYPGNRFLMSHLGENLASKGYVIVSIDHTDSTYEDQKAFASTLYNRPLDQLFVLREMARLSSPGSGCFLDGLVDATRTGVVGYSMGGYGLVNAIGGGFSDAAVTMAAAPPQRLLAERAASSPAYRQTLDTRIKAAIAIGPWGMQAGFWDAEGLAGIRTPVLFVAGSADDVSGYEKGTRALFERAVNAERYLLTFVNANHNAAAPYPAPAEVMSGPAGVNAYTHYADPGVGHDADEQHPATLRDRLLRSLSEGRRCESLLLRCGAAGQGRRLRRGA